MLLKMAINATICSTFEVQYGKSTSSRTSAIRHLGYLYFYVHKVDAQGTRHLPPPADVRDICFWGGWVRDGANLLWLRCQATDSSEQSQRDSCEPLTAVAEREDQITV